MHPIIRKFSFLISGLGLLLSLIVVPVWSAIDRHTYPTEAPAGLQEVISPEFDIVYIKPGFQPGDYGKLIIDDPRVALDDEWEQIHRKELSERDRRRIESDTTKVLREQFADKLSAQSGYVVIGGEETAGRGVLRLKPAMLDLYLNAPDPATPGIKDEWVRSAGNATLYLDLYDAASGELLLRIIDRSEAQRLQPYEGNRAAYKLELRLLIGRWAKALRKHLDSLNTGTA